MLHSFYAVLGKTNLYGIDKEENFFSAAPTMWTGKNDDFENRAVLTSELQKHFGKPWEIKYRKENNELENLLHFAVQTGIVRFDNPETNEFFVINYVSLTRSVDMFGRLSKENCEKLQNALTSYGHHLEDSNWLNSINLTPEKRYGNLSLYKTIFEKEGLIVSFCDKTERQRDSLIISAKGFPDLSIKIPLETAQGTKKSRANVLKDITEQATAFSPDKGVSTYLTFLYDLPYESAITQQSIERGKKLKAGILNALQQKQTVNLTPDPSITKNNLKR